MREPEVRESEEYKKGKAYAMNRLARIECSSEDLRRKLIQRDIPSEMASLIVDEMMQKSWVSDERYTNMLVRQQATRGNGAKLIQQKLKEKGITLSCDQVRLISNEVTDTTELETAKRLVERKYSTFADDRKVAARASQALLRRGFSYDIIRQILKY